MFGLPLATSWLLLHFEFYRQLIDWDLIEGASDFELSISHIRNRSLKPSISKNRIRSNKFCARGTESAGAKMIQ